MARAPNGYYKSVFINAPFTPDRAVLFNAMVFTVQAAGFAPHCARELDNAGQVRLDKIKDLIRTCHLGIHDISFMELDGDVPRFNMPFELGLFLGASAFGEDWVARKACTILDSEAFRYQRALSDIAGQDIRVHGLNAEIASAEVRNWLSHHTRSRAPILGGGGYLEFLRGVRSRASRLGGGCRSGRRESDFQRETLHRRRVVARSRSLVTQPQGMRGPISCPV